VEEETEKNEPDLKPGKNRVFFHSFNHEN
jgi:hypothetical protein